MPDREGAPSGPQRRCAACRARRPKAELLRFVRTPDGVEPDPEQVGRGRGGYCCRDPACVERGLRRGGLARTLRTSLSQEDAGRLAAWALEYLKVSTEEQRRGRASPDMWGASGRRTTWREQQ